MVLGATEGIGVLLFQPSTPLEKPSHKANSLHCQSTFAIPSSLSPNPELQKNKSPERPSYEESLVETFQRISMKCEGTAWASNPGNSTELREAGFKLDLILKSLCVNTLVRVVAGRPDHERLDKLTSPCSCVGHAFPNPDSSPKPQSTTV